MICFLLRNKSPSYLSILKKLFWLILALVPQLSGADDTISIQLPECNATLERRTVEPHVVSVRSGCPLSLSSLASLLEQGLQGFSPNHAPTAPSISIGRLQDYPDWSHLLAETAAKSSLWDSKRGQPRKRGYNDNGSVTVLLNGPAYPQALRAAFARQGLKLCVAYVEKVLIFKAKDIWPDQQRIAKSIPANARLPVDAQVWLTLQPLVNACGTR